MGNITMKKVSTEIGKFLDVLPDWEDIFELHKLRNNALDAIEKELCKKYPLEMSGKVNVELAKACEMRTLGKYGLNPKPLFIPVFLIMYEHCKMSTRVAVELFKSAYTTGNGIDKEECLEIFGKFEYSDFLYNNELITEYSILPQLLTIYRGGSMLEYDNCDFGLSWTTDRACAEFFAFRGKEEQRAIFSKVVDKSEIIYFGNDRQESEVIYTDNYFDEQITVVTKEPTDFYKKWYNRQGLNPL